ncbi:hypothetical protein ABTX34_34640 [Streptomyces sp. NPDC096538]|uniref:hypothetical protein n=1 Tax=Streptomyces sp. NPDC096538 TaxID=3155427 RepID=UPI0033211069
MQCGQELGRQRAACRIRDQGDDLDAIGGLFTYAPEKQLYYAVEAEAVLGHGGAQLAQQARQAVQGFSDPTAPNWAFGDLASSQCDLALVRLYGGDLDGAAAAIRPVLDLPASHRTAPHRTAPHRTATTGSSCRRCASGRP